MTNAFENNEQPIPEVEVRQTPEIDSEVARLEATNEGLRKLGLYRTAEINQAKIDRLLQRKRDLLEG